MKEGKSFNSCSQRFYFSCSWEMVWNNTPVGRRPFLVKISHQGFLDMNRDKIGTLVKPCLPAQNEHTFMTIYAYMH